ncbi:hypothetical protein DPMN_169897, partial [Dreissena polymorpha]
MSPELLQKLDAAAKTLDAAQYTSMDNTNNIVSALERTLDSAKEIILVDEKMIDTPKEHVIYFETPRPESTEFRLSDSCYDIEKEYDINGIAEDPQSQPEPHDHHERHEPHEESDHGHFEISVDISEALPQAEDDSSEDDTKRITLSTPELPSKRRRSSRWSATVLFLASEVQMMVNLAHLSPPDGFELAPPKNEPGAPDGNDKGMSETLNELELQPMGDQGTNGDRPIRCLEMVLPKEYSNGDIITLCDNCDLPPPYDNLQKDKSGDEDDKHSLISNKNDDDRPDDKENSDKPDEEAPRDAESICSEPHPPHEDWGHKADFLLAVIGYAVDLSNVWRFPYLCYRNGGGAFIIPYFTVLIFGALPIFYMELCLGQFHREGPIAVWKIVPMFKGIGYASCFMAYIVAFYYNVVIGWAFYYLFSSFTLDLPWRHCDREWNSPNCWLLGEGKFNTSGGPNVTVSNMTVSNMTHAVSSSYEFFERGMLRLHLSRGLEHLGGVRWELVLCTLLTFICLYFSLWKGVKSSGK